MVKSVLFVCMGNISRSLSFDPGAGVVRFCHPVRGFVSRCWITISDLSVPRQMFDPEHSLEQRILDEQFL